MANLLTFVDQNADTLQQMALLAYLKEPDVGEPLLQAITTYKVSIFKILNFLLMVFFILASDYGEVSTFKPEDRRAFHVDIFSVWTSVEVKSKN